jgi:hypothetical protein
MVAVDYSRPVNFNKLSTINQIVFIGSIKLLFIYIIEQSDSV